MTTTLTHPERKTIFDLSPEDRAAEYEAARECVRETSREMVQGVMARKPDPRSAYDYRVWHDSGYVAVLVAQHVGRTTSLEVSPNGGRKRAFLTSDPRKVMIQPESDNDFLLIALPRSLAKWVLERQRVNLLGVTPDLIVGDYTDEQRETWARLRKTCETINIRIQSPPSPRVRAAGHRSNI